ncbi:MAG: tRNA (N6-isopentenyl adenosine(37)-C2)-methylthiotransferase MiaB [Bacteroidales bacterium]|nr:tRNA (N6-isopentenyl adenosine(37)-C2)-methylthiotransferase MiaB [Bacteroidales bacterium]
MKKRVYIETYGCQMNVSDTQVIYSILSKEGYEFCQQPADADLILMNTCSIREHAEEKIISRAKELISLKKKKPGLKIGIVGCMSTWNKQKLFDKIPQLDLIAGPDSYRNLPLLLKQSYSGETHLMDILLSNTETYEDILPYYPENYVTAFVSIMRGCNNFCAYCVVPFTRGRERSRPLHSIMNEVHDLMEKGVKEITFLGQNVNSYKWDDGCRKWFFPDLLDHVATHFPSLRIRFATSHPKDVSRELVEVMAQYPNIAPSIHLPLQSGSNRILRRMNRNYTLEEYKEKIQWFYDTIPGITVSTDIIAGFCGETEEDHQKTLEAMKDIHFFYAYMFKYSERPGTLAAQKYVDDVADDVKTRRLQEIIQLQQQLSYEHNLRDINKTFDVLIEGPSHKNPNEWFGRTGQNKVVVFPFQGKRPGDVVKVKVVEVTSATLRGIPWPETNLM